MTLSTYCEKRYELMRCSSRGVSTEGGKSSHKLWFGKARTADRLRAFRAVGYAKKSVREYKFVAIPGSFPNGTVSVLLVKTRKIMGRQAVRFVVRPDKTGGDGTGSNYGSRKPIGNGTMVTQATVHITELAVDTTPQEPRNRRQAKDSSKWNRWQIAEKAEKCGMADNLDDSPLMQIATIKYKIRMWNTPTALKIYCDFC